MLDNSKTFLHLASLKEGIPALTPALGGALAEAASICLAEQGHEEQCALQIRRLEERGTCTLFRLDVSDIMRRTYRDLQEATEMGACGVAILAVRSVTGYTAIERSVKGTGFDYWLGALTPSAQGLEPLERKARLEVSGILHGTTAAIEARVHEKIRQTQRSRGAFPAIVAVVEFGRPLIWMKQDE